jgi:hypothetical protein
VTRLRVLVVLLVAASVGAAAFVSFRAEQDTPAKRELLLYFETSFRDIHEQTRIVQGAIAQLIEGDKVPDAATAALMLEENLIPSVDHLIRTAQGVVLAEAPTRAIHAEYLVALEGTRADLYLMRRMYRDDAGGEAAKRRAAHRIAAGIGRRFDQFTDRAVRTWIEHGIAIEAPRRDAGQ